MLNLFVIISKQFQMKNTVRINQTNNQEKLNGEMILLICTEAIKGTLMRFENTQTFITQKNAGDTQTLSLILSLHEASNS